MYTFYYFIQTDKQINKGFWDKDSVEKQTDNIELIKQPITECFDK